MLEAYHVADAVRDRPSIVFAYTVKGWSLPIEGHPSNHSALLDDKQFRHLAEQLGYDAEDPWRGFDPDTPEGALCAIVGERLERPAQALEPPPEVPPTLGREHRGSESTQQAFGRLFIDLGHAAPEVERRIVTVSPDVASSTNLGGWINKAGIWFLSERTDWFADDTNTLVRWHEDDSGRHIELGIAEVNLVGLLGELGATWSRHGRPLLPVGTIYDPFVGRALEPWSFGIYAGGQSILVGTPSGVTLGPEGGAHQSIVTPSIGIEQPGCSAWEPAFGLDFEWAFLHALGRLGRAGGEASYFRLSTRPLDQALASVPAEGQERERRRRQVLAGGYCLRAPDGEPACAIVAMGAVVPEALAAAELLGEEAGIAAEVICVTSADLLFRALQARRGLREGSDAILDELFPRERPLPIVSVLDGHPHTLAFLGTVQPAPLTALGVQQFGQSGDIGDLYEWHGIDPETIVGAALDLLS